MEVAIIAIVILQIMTLIALGFIKDHLVRLQDLMPKNTPQAVMTPFIITDDQTNTSVVIKDEGVGTYKGPQSWT